MIKDYLIVIPSSNPWEWSADYVRQTAKKLAECNKVIVFLCSEVPSIKEALVSKKKVLIWRQINNNLLIFQAINWLPFKRFSQIAKLNFQINLLLLKVLTRWVSRNNHIKQKLLWIFNPIFYSINNIIGKDYYLLYDCLDYFVGSNDKTSSADLEQKEIKLLQTADLVVANSKILQQHCQQYRKKVHLVPQGFDIEAFKKSKPTKVKLAKKPVIGFVGGINYRLAYDLLIDLVKRNSQWHFVFWGPIQIDSQDDHFNTQSNIRKLLSYPNVTHDVSTSRHEIPSIIKQFDICTIPYDVSQPFNKFCYPMKLFEYFYMGKPIVSTHIKELKHYPQYVKIGKISNEWQHHINCFLAHPWPKAYQHQQKQLAIENSWNRKFSIIIDNIHFDNVI